jgi:hypothetical protein
MRGKTNRRILLGVLLVLAAGVGCNPILLPFYVLGGLNRTTKDPEYKFYEIARKDKGKKEFKLVVLPERGRGLSANFFGQERKLASVFVENLSKSFEENKEKIKIVPIKDVEAYRSKCSREEWKSMLPQDIGKHFGADYVLVMELSQLSLYEPNSFGQFLHGQCRVSLTLVDVEKDEPIKQWEPSLSYPKDGKNQVADLDTNEEKFKQEVFTHLAGKMCRYITASPTPEYMDID